LFAFLVLGHARRQLLWFEVTRRAEASSKLTRDRVWNWFTDDWGTKWAA
jgi:hypothetical protein